jgi:predicted O-linked N-acetylglucosamine transferase (SPINDLY family)
MNHAAHSAAPSTRKLMKLAENAMQKGRGQEAVNLLQQVLALNPAHVEAIHKIAFILHSAGSYAQAEPMYQRAIQTDPSYMESYLLLCKVYEAQNRAQEALQLAHHATRVAPDNPDTHAELMSLLLRFNLAHEVLPYLAQVLPRFPDNLDLHQFQCIAYKINGRREEGDTAYRAMLARFKVPASFRITYETYLPRLVVTNAEIDAMRADFAASIERFIAEKPRFNIGLLAYHPLFGLAFHNRDNKQILQRYTAMLRAIAPELNYTAPHARTPRKTPERIRLAFASRHMNNHSVGNCYRGILMKLASMPEFEVRLFVIGSAMDEKMQELANAGVELVPLPNNIGAAQKFVASYAPDIMIYPDIGMDATTHYLAMARLAPHQACFQGHPETTGIDTIDYVISSRSYEPENAQENYTEHVLCNPGIDTLFMRPTPPARWLSREELGLPTDRKLYVCPLAIQKFHPDFDEVLAGILDRDPHATLVLFNDYQQQVASERLKQRILAWCDASRIIFLDWQPLEALFSILRTADTLLDTLYFGAGTTSQYAFAFGLPIVTMPGAYARGRVVHSYYNIMGIVDAPMAKDIAEYVEMAHRLAHDATYKERLSADIMANNHKMFDARPYEQDIAQLLRDMMAGTLDAYQR